MARTVLVVGAVGLVALGVLAATSGVARAAAIGAGLVLSLLDRALVRHGARAAPKPEVTGWSAAVSLPSAGSTPGERGAVRASADTVEALAVDHERSVLVGHTLGDARAVRTDAPHVVVVGRGALARAVFDAIAVQCRAAAAEVRDSDALPDGLTAPGDGTAVVVCTDARAGSRRTVVLVAEHGHVPRRADLLVTVGRTGCTARTDDGRAVRILPVLPSVEPPAGPSRADRDTRERTRRRPRAQLSAGRLRRGPPPPAHPRRAPAHRSPP
ncbi:hypothetical protein [Curtobacterium sp. NPDC089689]|uniref:hypothetical protein n=1 Tax=Curtobacterium sp. NPDC089689 TaxID=3363968 RepID=UPI0038064683